MHDFHEIIEKKLASRVIAGDIPKEKEIHDMSNQTIVDTLRMIIKTDVNPKYFNAFVATIKETGRLKIIIQEIYRTNNQ